MRGLDLNARSRKAAIIAAASVSALTLAIPGTAFAYGSSNHSNNGRNHSYGNTSNWQKDWRHSHHHGGYPVSNQGGNGRSTGSCVINVPSGDQKDGITQIIIKDGRNGYHVVFVDGSSVAGHYQPCFPLTNPAGGNNGNGNGNHSSGNGNGSGNNHGGTTTTTVAPTTTSTTMAPTTTTSSTSTTMALQGSSTNSGNGPTVGGQSVTMTTDPGSNTGGTGTASNVTPASANVAPAGANVLGESINADPGSTGTSAGAGASDPSAAPASVLAEDATSDPSSLAFTGANVAEMTGIGVVLVGIGAASLFARRRSLAGNES
jgi:hypothetical protein